MLNPGKLLIMGIVSVAAIAAGGAWWYQYQQGQRVLQFWGTDDALRIRLSPVCELLLFAPSAAAASPAPSSSPGAALPEAIRAVLADSPWPLAGHQSLVGTPGLIHARQALIDDASYAWQNSAPAPTHCQYGLAFVDAQGATVLAFDLEQQVIVDVQNPERRANIGPIRQGFQKFFAELAPVTPSAP